MSAPEGVKLIDVGQFYSGPYCTIAITRPGAEMIEIEAPEGDPNRRLPTVDGDLSPSAAPDSAPTARCSCRSWPPLACWRRCTGGEQRHLRNGADR
ncbi:CoA transferase [Tsukamurella soli]|uniref:CoA transferase n=1 Tax=Tsukamurella soli TaxID=644556 RepID=UPI0031F172B1